jgi:endogenous inhibitor of DNA gyrase (YacG/DUF329 family)
MTWSPEQTHQIVEQFWENIGVRCPNDNGPLKLRLRKFRGGDYDLLAACPVCGKRKELRRADDPHRRRFRRWTIGEVQRVSESVARIGAALCPVCGAPIDWQAAPGLLLLRCFRCGNSNSWRHVYTPN